MVLALLLLALAAPINLTAINEQQGHVVHSLPGGIPRSGAAL